jgi:hypothetical protein
MDNCHTVIFAAAVVCIHQLLAAYTILFDDIPTKAEVMSAKKHAREPLIKETF